MGVFGALLALSMASVAQACDSPKVVDASVVAQKEPQLAFRQDGAALVITATISINGSPRVLLTSHRIDGNNVTLRYTVIQSSDPLIRCLKPLTIEWHTRRITNQGVRFKVEGNQLSFADAELKQLSEQLPVTNAKR